LRRRREEVDDDRSDGDRDGAHPLKKSRRSSSASRAAPLPSARAPSPPTPRIVCSAAARAHRDTNADPAALEPDELLVPAIEINNVVCALLEDPSRIGEAASTMKTALESLERAVRIVRSTARDEKSLRERRVWSRTNDMAALRAKALLLRDDGRPSSSSSAIADAAAAGDLDPLIYRVPVRVPISCLASAAPPKPHRPCAMLDRQLLSSVLLFNFALSNHLAGLKFGRDECVRRSVELYRLSESSLMKAKQQPQQTSVAGAGAASGISRHLAKAILNNLGQICMRRGKVAWGREYFAGLQTLCEQEAAERALVARGDANHQSRRVVMDVFAFNALASMGMNTAPIA